MVLERGKDETLDTIDETQIETDKIAATAAIVDATVTAVEKLLHQLQKTSRITMGPPLKLAA